MGSARSETVRTSLNCERKPTEAVPPRVHAQEGEVGQTAVNSFNSSTCAGETIQIIYAEKKVAGVGRTVQSAARIARSQHH